MLIKLYTNRADFCDPVSYTSSMNRNLNIPQIRPDEPVNTYIKRIADANVIDLDTFYIDVIQTRHHPNYVLAPLVRLSELSGLTVEDLEDHHTIFPVLRYFLTPVEVSQAKLYMVGYRRILPQMIQFPRNHIYFDTVQEAVSIIPEVNPDNDYFIQGLLKYPLAMNRTTFGAIGLLHSVCDENAVSPLLNYYAIPQQAKFEAEPSLILSDAIRQFQTPEQFIVFANAHREVLQYSEEPIRVCATLTALAENLGYEPIEILSYGINCLIYRAIMKSYPDLEPEWLNFLEQKSKSSVWYQDQIILNIIARQRIALHSNDTDGNA